MLIHKNRLNLSPLAMIILCGFGIESKEASKNGEVRLYVPFGMLFPDGNYIAVGCGGDIEEKRRMDLWVVLKSYKTKI